MKQRFLARMRTALDEIEQNAPADLALFEYVDLLTAQIPRPTRTLFASAAEGDLLTTRALIELAEMERMDLAYELTLRNNPDFVHAINFDCDPISTPPLAQPVPILREQ